MVLRPSGDSSCPGLNFLLDWVENLVADTTSPRVALSVHLQRTNKGFGLQIGYSTDLRRLVVEGVYEFVQSSNGWPVSKGDILTAVDTYELPANNNGQWLIDNVVRTFGSITDQTRVSFHRPVSVRHQRLLLSIRRSLVRMLRLERDAKRWFPSHAVRFLWGFINRLNTEFAAVFTRPCGQEAVQARDPSSADEAAALEAARLHEWGRVALFLQKEVQALETGLYVVVLDVSLGGSLAFQELR